jgi:hypothetical protein
MWEFSYILDLFKRCALRRHNRQAATPAKAAMESTIDRVSG